MKKKHTTALATLSAGLLLTLPGLLSAQSNIGINFAGRDPGFPLAPWESTGAIAQTNWNNIAGGDGGAGNSGTTVPLEDSNGAFTAVTLTYQANDSWHSDGGVANSDDKLMKGIQKANPDPDTTPANNTDKMVFTLNNLGAGPVDVIVYGTHNGAGALMSVNVGATTFYFSEEADFNAFAQGSSVDPNNYETAVNYVVFPGVTPASGTIVVTAAKKIVDPQVTDGIGVAAIQIVNASGSFPANAAALAITNQPASASAGVGDAVTFNVAYSGPANVQWQKKWGEYTWG